MNGSNIQSSNYHSKHSAIMDAGSCIWRSRQTHRQTTSGNFMCGQFHPDWVVLHHWRLRDEESGEVHASNGKFERYDYNHPIGGPVSNYIATHCHDTSALIFTTPTHQAVLLRFCESTQTPDDLTRDLTWAALEGWRRRTPELWYDLKSHNIVSSAAHYLSDNVSKYGR
jgi:hypothetical protein